MQKEHDCVFVHAETLSTFRSMKGNRIVPRLDTVAEMFWNGAREGMGLVAAL